MNRIIKLAIVLIILLVGALVSFYLLYTPKEAPIVNAKISENELQVKQLTDLSKYDNGDYYLFLYSEGVSYRNDVNYVLDEAVQPLLSSLKKDEFSFVQSVKLVEYAEFSNDIKTQWMVSTIPSFVKVHVENGKVSIVDSLQWDSEKPYDDQILKEWFIKHGIWPGT